MLKKTFKNLFINLNGCLITTAKIGDNCSGNTVCEEPATCQPLNDPNQTCKVKEGGPCRKNEHCEVGICAEVRSGVLQCTRDVPESLY